MVEIAPSAVSMSLHGDRKDLDDNRNDKNKVSLSVEEFMEFVRKGLESDKETIWVGMSEEVVERWYGEFGGDYGKAVSD